MLLAAVITALGESTRAVFLVQALLSVMTVVLVGYIGRLLGGWPVAVVAASIVAISPMQLFQLARGDEGRSISPCPTNRCA